MTPGAALPRAPEHDLEAFFEKAYGVFLEALDSAPETPQRCFSIGGHIIQLRFGGTTLVPYTVPAIQHLAVSPQSNPGLRVYLWDSVSTHTKMPSPPWSLDDYIARGDIRGNTVPHIHIAFNPAAGVLSMLNTRKRLALCWVRHAPQIPNYVQAAPLREILFWWMRAQGRFLIHAGAVGTSTGGVLLAGQSGAGKSTSSLACINSGLGFASDNYCLVASDPAPYAYSLYNCAKLEFDNVRRFEILAPYIHDHGETGDDKAIVYLHENLPECIVKGFPLRAIVLPRITGGNRSTIEPALSVEGLKAVLPNSILPLPGAKPGDFFALAAIVKKLPCYFLNMGTHVEDIPGVIQACIAMQKG